MKNIILLSDGTGNTNIKDRGTNVFKLYEAIDFHCQKIEQVAFYDDGVGAEDVKPIKIMGGAFGWGLTRNIIELYKNLVQCYQPGDAIYLFGFSRGAFTVRSLAGFIAKQGILKHENYATDDALHHAIWHRYADYRHDNLARFERPIAASIHKPVASEIHSNPNIKFIGVWDTVDAVGLPFDEAADFLNDYIFRFKFKNFDLHPTVEKACHALSIDDERQSFKPLLWNHDTNNPERIEQVWFPGVHANVGGGYPQQGLSMLALDWMMQKAKAAGLHLIETDLKIAHDKEYAYDKMYDSRSGLRSYYRYKPRNIAEICKTHKIPVSKIHESTFQRIAAGILDYAPGNLPNEFIVVTDDGSVHPNSQKIVDLIKSKEPATDASSDQAFLLAQGDGAKFVRLRKLMYKILLGFSFFTLYQLLLGSLKTSNTGLFGEIKEMVSPDGLLNKLAMLCWEKPIYAIVAIIIVAMGIRVRKNLRGVFTSYWGGLRAGLRQLV